jgi:5-methylthioadenosine/S-adenosylhomocysteine deaminase
MSVSLLAARWVLPITSPVIEDGAVVVDDETGLIRAVGSLAQLRLEFPEAPVTDHGQGALLPGLVNVHSHLELTALRGRVEHPLFQPWILSLITLKANWLGEAELLTSARLGCLEAIRAGVTTLADTADAAGTVSSLLEAGLRGIVFQECFGPDPAQAEAGLAQFQLKLEAHRAQLDRAPSRAARRIQLGISPHAPYSVSARLYQLATALAHDQQLDMALHAAESLDERSLLLDGSGAFGDSLRRRDIPFTPPGCSTVRYLDQLGVLAASPLLIHGVTIEAEELDLLATRGVRLAHCPKSNSKFGHGVADLPAWRRHGLAVGLGTDSVASNNGADLIEEARFATLLHRAHRSDPHWPTAAAMLAMLTIDGARALRLDDRIGSLEVGKCADLIAIDLAGVQTTPASDPVTTIIFSASARDVVMTMVDGRILYQGDHLLTLDQPQILRDCERIFDRPSPSA